MGSKQSNINKKQNKNPPILSMKNNDNNNNEDNAHNHNPNKNNVNQNVENRKWNLMQKFRKIFGSPRRNKPKHQRHREDDHHQERPPDDNPHQHPSDKIKNNLSPTDDTDSNDPMIRNRSPPSPLSSSNSKAQEGVTHRPQPHLHTIIKGLEKVEYYNANIVGKQLESINQQIAIDRSGKKKTQKMRSSVVQREKEKKIEKNNEKTSIKIKDKKSPRHNYHPQQSERSQSMIAAKTMPKMKLNNNYNSISSSCSYSIGGGGGGSSIIGCNDDTEKKILSRQISISAKERLKSPSNKQDPDESESWRSIENFTTTTASSTTINASNGSKIFIPTPSPQPATPKISKIVTNEHRVKSNLTTTAAGRRILSNRDKSRLHKRRAARRHQAEVRKSKMKAKTILNISKNNAKNKSPNFVIQDASASALFGKSKDCDNNNNREKPNSPTKTKPALVAAATASLYQLPIGERGFTAGREIHRPNRFALTYLPAFTPLPPNVKTENFEYLFHKLNELNMAMETIERSYLTIVRSLIKLQVPIEKQHEISGKFVAISTMNQSLNSNRQQQQQQHHQHVKQHHNHHVDSKLQYHNEPHDGDNKHHQHAHHQQPNRNNNNNNNQQQQHQHQTVLDGNRQMIDETIARLTVARMLDSSTKNESIAEMQQLIEELNVALDDLHVYYDDEDGKFDFDEYRLSEFRISARVFNTLLGRVNRLRNVAVRVLQYYNDQVINMFAP